MWAVCRVAAGMEGLVAKMLDTGDTLEELMVMVAGSVEIQALAFKTAAAATSLRSTMKGTIRLALLLVHAARKTQVQASP